MGEYVIPGAGGDLRLKVDFRTDPGQPQKLVVLQVDSHAVEVPIAQFLQWAQAREHGSLGDDALSVLISSYPPRSAPVTDGKLLKGRRKHREVAISYLYLQSPPAFEGASGVAQFKPIFILPPS